MCLFCIPLRCVPFSYIYGILILCTGIDYVNADLRTHYTHVAYRDCFVNFLITHYVTCCAILRAMFAMCRDLVRLLVCNMVYSVSFVVARIIARE